jgi:hypothetical protein
MEEVMKRQIRNAIASLVITAFVGIGLMAFGQDPCCPQPACPPHPVVVQPVAQPAVIQTVEQTVQQPVAAQTTVEQTCIQPVAVQTVEPTCVQPVAVQATACADLCDLVKSIEKHADHLRKDFKDSLDCLDCVDESYYESVKAFEKATDRLKKHYRDDCDSCDIAADVQEVLSLANCISAYMDPCSLCPEAIEEWAGLQADLQQLGAQFCTVASFQPPISLQPPVPAFAPVAPVVQPVQCPLPAPVVQPVQCPAPVAQPVCPATGEVIYK